MFDYVWRDEFPEFPEDILTKNQRDVIYLRYYLCMGFSEMSRELGRSKQALQRSHKQAIDRIDKFMSDVKLLKLCLRCEELLESDYSSVILGESDENLPQGHDNGHT